MSGRSNFGFGEGVVQAECPYATIAVEEIKRLHDDGEGLTLALHRTSQQIVETMYDAERGADINAPIDDIPDHVVRPVVDLVVRRTEQMGALSEVDGTSFALIDALDTCTTCDAFGTSDFTVCEFAASAVTTLVTRRFYRQ